MPHVSKFMIKLFDRKDGEAADWSMIAETLSLAMFEIADKLPANNARALRSRIHEQSYDAAAADPVASKTPTSGAVSRPSNTGLFKALALLPPK